MTSNSEYISDLVSTSSHPSEIELLGPRSIQAIDVLTRNLGIHCDVCFYCCGYYGPCFGQPVCAVCHAFLFPESPLEEKDENSEGEKDDSGDSGNEEPVDLFTLALAERRRKLNRRMVENVLMPQDIERPDDLSPNPENGPGSEARPSDILAVVDKNSSLNGAQSRSLSNPTNATFDQAVANSNSSERSGLGVSGPGRPPGPNRKTARQHDMIFHIKPGRFRSLSSNNGFSNVRSEKLQEKIFELTTPRETQRMPTQLVNSLPPEVLIAIFRHLDDLSLWIAMQVCRRWEQLIIDEYSDQKWKTAINQRWPLFEPLVSPKSWRLVYFRLAKSAPCLLCLDQMMLLNSDVEENSWRNRRLRSELKALKSDPPEGIQATPLDRFYCHWQATITGPQGSPYEGGCFYLYMQIPPSYPMKPPIVRFLTKTFHPNISRHGDIGLDSIHHNWSLALTISKVLISIQSLLTDPFVEACMEPQIGSLYRNDVKEFGRVARIWTWRYAMHDFLPAIEPKFFEGL